MRITKKALAKATDKIVRAKLALALNTTDQSIRNYIKANKDNGPLTTAAALTVIRQETGLADKDILANHSVPSL